MDDASVPDLLFGLLALEAGRIDGDQLAAAFRAWNRDRSRPLAGCLEALGALDAADRTAVETMVRLRQDPGPVDLTRSQSARVASELTRLDPSPPGGAELAPTVSMSPLAPAPGGIGGDGPGSGSRAGRFRVLRPYARGGLGVVSVALDAELNREVALKQILDRFADDPASRERFLVEAEITGSLEHPGIVPVYGLGTYADGRPYYAMRFIRGRSLRDAIQAFHHPAPGNPPAAGPGSAGAVAARALEFRGLLRRFLDVCNTVGYAHSRGVIHLDLKPANIILGPYGETLVVDWGLARATGVPDPAAPEGSVHVTTPGGSRDGQGSKVEGTVSYMAPEQARADAGAIGRPADLYALGATLYHLLTGRLAFEGRDLHALLERVRRGDFAPPRGVNRSVPPALEAVCLKAMAREPGDRYGTAGALAEDIERWLADEPVGARREPWPERARRWVRRHRTAAIAAAAASLVGLVSLGGLAAVQTRARRVLDAKNTELAVSNARVVRANQELTQANAALERLRRRAEDREELAIAAVKRFQDAVLNEPRLRDTPALEELRRALLREPLSFFQALRDRLQVQADARPESLVALADASFRLGMLADDLGDKQDALRAYREALALRESGDGGPPLPGRFDHDVAAIYNNMGNLLGETGQAADALAAYERALELRQAQAAAEPGRPGVEQRVAAIWTNIGQLRRDTGQSLAARRAFESALAIQRRLLEVDPENPDLLDELAASHDHLGGLLGQAGATAAGIAEVRQAIAIRERLLQSHPEHGWIASHLVVSRNNLGTLLLEAGDVPAAIASYSRAMTQARTLLEAHPTVSRYRQGLANSKSLLGTLLRQTGRPEQAQPLLESARELQAELIRANPTVTDHRNRLAAIETGLGLLHRARRQPELALAAFEAALAIQEPLAAANPTVATYQDDRAASYSNRGLLRRELGDPDAALADFRRALEIQRTLVAGCPENPVFRNNLAGTLNNLSLVFGQLGRGDEAAAAVRESLTIRESLTRDFPDSAPFRSALGSSLNNLALADQRAGRLDEALDKLRRAAELQRQALQANPGNPVYRRFLGNHYRGTAEIARELGRDDEAAAAQAAFEALQADP